MNYAVGISAMVKGFKQLRIQNDISDLDIVFLLLCSLLAILFYNFCEYLSSKDSAQSSDSTSKTKTIIYVGEILLCGLFLFYVDDLQSKEREAKLLQETEKFLKTPEGLDKTAREQSLISNDIITSKTGKMFFHGEFCDNHCLELKSKYDREEKKRQEHIKKDEIARKKSLSNIVVSETGNLFYQGIECKEKCIGYNDGYTYAWDKGITNEDACDSDSKTFKKGCLDGIKDVIKDLREYLREEYPEDYDSDNDNIYYDEEDKPRFPFAE